VIELVRHERQPSGEEPGLAVVSPRWRCLAHVHYVRLACLQVLSGQLMPRVRPRVMNVLTTAKIESWLERTVGQRLQSAVKPSQTGTKQGDAVNGLP
jgi:hypothetical protein